MQDGIGCMLLRVLTSRLIPIMLAVVCLTGLILSGCAGGASLPESISFGETATQYPEVDAFVKQQMQADDIPGVVVVVVRGDEVIYCKGFGVASLETNKPLTPQTIFDLASVSKSFTALGVLLLQDKGLIDIDMPVQHYLPDFQPNDERASEITLRQLLNHTSGLPGAFSAPLIFQEGEDEMKELVAALSRVRLNREPGSSFEYADINYCLLGALIERVTGTTFEEYIQQEIFEPLGMDNTTLYPDEAAALDRADGHQPLYGRIVTRNMPVYRSSLPAGWVMSCAEDMIKWLIVHLNGGCNAEGQIFPGNCIEEAHTTAVLFEENGEEMGYGMGWFISDNNETQLVWHGGDTPTFTADMLLLSEYDAGVVVLVNSQACTIGHNIAPGVINRILGMELETMSVPWWAHWKTIDTIATFALVVITLILLAMAFYLWWLWRQFKKGEKCFIRSPLAKPLPHVWQVALFVTPLVLLVMFSFASYLVGKTLYGYNLFEMLVLFRLGAPPGVYISGVVLLVVFFLWALLLALVAIFTRGSKAAA